MDRRKGQIMNLRKELLQYLYDTVINKGLCPELQKAAEEALDLAEQCFEPDSKEEGDAMGKLCRLEYTAFMAGANTILDFIAGREVQ